MKVVKESSDELNPPVVTRANIAPTPRRRTPLDQLALALATCGVGLLPLAPGTWGALVGVGLYVGARALSLRVFSAAAVRGASVPPLVGLQTALVLLLLLGLTLLGVWAATRAERVLGRKDPGAVVIDEVVGQLITYAFVPLSIGVGPLLLGFVLFRVFDIWKPYPIRRLEALESGLGIMADDVLAGFYAATALSLLTSLYLLVV